MNIMYGELVGMPTCISVTVALATLVLALFAYIFYQRRPEHAVPSQQPGATSPLRFMNLCVQILQRAPFGRSPCGAVFQGLWDGTRTTIKVTRHHCDAASDDVYERRYRMSHPNVVQLYGFRRDVVQQPVLDDQASFEDKLGASFVSGALHRWGMSGPISLPRAIDSCSLSSPYSSRSSVPNTFFTPPEGTVEVVQVYEDLDRGSLWDYIETEKLSPPVNPAAEEKRRLVITRTLLDVGRGLSHMHASGFAHGELTTHNIFLKSAGPRESRGFIAKIGDFSLGEGNVLQGQSPSTFWPTIAHIAPEALRGHRDPAAATTTARDIYAFGNLMYEVYTGEEAYAGLTWQDVKTGKVENELQPKFPACCPPAFEQLARQCWDANPANRPTAQEVVRSLESIEQQLRVTTLPSDLDANFACINGWPSGPGSTLASTVVPPKEA